MLIIKDFMLDTGSSSSIKLHFVMILTPREHSLIDALKINTSFVHQGQISHAETVRSNL